MPIVSQQYQPPLVSLADVVRNYQENGVKLLLQHGLNMRDLLRLLSIYILLEHMSEPDPFMKLFLLEYVMQAYGAQVRTLGHVRKVEPILDPVLPVVFYTGTRTWDKLADLSELVKNRVALAEYLPGERWQPRFINLGVLPEEKLKTDGGYLGQALRILREHRGRGEEFLHLFREVLTALDSMQAEDQHNHPQVLAAVASHATDQLCVSTVTLEVQIGGWSALARSAKTPQRRGCAEGWSTAINGKLEPGVSVCSRFLTG